MDRLLSRVGHALLLKLLLPREILLLELALALLLQALLVLPELLLALVCVVLIALFRSVSGWRLLAREVGLVLESR